MVAGFATLKVHGEKNLYNEITSEQRSRESEGTASLTSAGKSTSRGNSNAEPLGRAELGLFKTVKDLGVESKNE